MRESSKVLRSESISTQTHDRSVALPPSQTLTTDQETFRETILTWLKQNAPETRIRHILRVEQLSIELAEHHELDVQKAAQAALMHDLAKFFKPERLLHMAKAEGLELDAIDEANPHLLHADVGAIVARDEFGVTDEEILDAIRNHTLGKPQMSALSCIVYLADGLEPGRGTSLELEELRRLSRQDLIEAMWKAADYSLSGLLQSRHLIHPRTVQTRNWFLHHHQTSKRE
jgi:predicted HD superfamily hydrolase involved in NAD metabolism